MRRLHVGYIGMDRSSREGLITLVDPTSNMLLVITLEFRDILSMINELQTTGTSLSDGFSLIRNLVTAFHGTLTRLVIDACNDGIFASRLLMEHRSSHLVFDVQIVYAVTLALRLGIPIFVEDSVWSAHAIRAEELRDVGRFEEDEQLTQWLDGLSPEDFT
ncbi:bifunctional nuclease family protein [bacterium]|nr:bifunctional nuclease family protein [candidate division CSSED10-310 bacterium]